MLRRPVTLSSGPRIARICARWVELVSLKLVNIGSMNTSTQKLEDQVSLALQQSPFIAGRKLRFETSEGKVVLHGVVASFFQKQMAQEALRGLDGVQHIENQLEVCWA